VKLRLSVSIHQIPRQLVIDQLNVGGVFAARPAGLQLPFVQQFSMYSEGHRPRHFAARLHGVGGENSLPGAEQRIR
jgi:hypothetical protein